MSSKSSSFRLPPHCGVGFSRNDLRASRRNPSIHSGSFLCMEIIATISSSIPLRGVLKKYSSGSLKPYLYSSSPRACMVLSSGIFSSFLGGGAELLPNPVVAFVLEILGELFAARGYYTSVEHDVNVVGLDVPQYPLVVRDHHRAELGAAYPVDALGDYLQRVYVEPRIGLVHNGQPGLKHEHLQDLVPLLLATGETFV